LMLYFSIAIAVMFPPFPVVFRVTQNVPDENFLTSVIDPGN
jgi:hypothetical protein